MILNPRALAIASALAIVGGGLAHATPPARLNLHLPAQAYSESLIALGLQGRVSVLGVSACPGRGPALSGVFTLSAALQILLRDAPCRAQMDAPDTVRLVARRLPSSPRPPRFVAAATAAPRSPPDTILSTPLDQVVVTAEKRSESPFQSAGDISVLGASRLEAVSALDVSDVAAQFAAVVLTNLGPGRDKLLLRGVSDGAFTGRTRSTLATYLDDAPITYNAPDPDLVLADVDRVEILAGPQGALYGGGSLGGVYRVVTRAPQFDAWGGSLQVRGALTEGGAGSNGEEATLNAPLLSGRLAVRTTLYDVEDGGYLQNDSLRSSNVDRTRRTGGRVAILAAPAPDWTVTLSGAVQHLTTADTQYTTLSGRNLRRANLVREGHKNDFDQAGLAVAGRLGSLTVHSATSFVRHDFTSRYDASAALSLFDAPTAEFGAYDETVRSTIVSQDVFVSSPEDRPLSWLAGAYASYLEDDTPSSLAARPAGSSLPQTLYSETRHDRLDEEALYGDLHLRLGDRWTLAAGGRVFRTGVSVDATTLTPLQRIQQRMLLNSRDDRGFSPKLSLQYAFDRRVSVYALVSRGDRPGGFNTGGLQAPGAALRAFAPDHLYNFETGVKARLTEGAEFHATLFHDRWSRIQTDQFFTSGLPYTANVGDGRLTGVELAASAQLFRRLTLEANALFTTSEIVNPTSTFAAGLQKGLPGAPQSAFNVYAAWDQPLARGLDLRLSARAAYVGHTRLTYDATPASTTSSAFLDAELTAQLLFGRYSLALNLTNPADDRTDTFAYGNPFSFGQVRQATPQRPRTLELVANARF